MLLYDKRSVKQKKESLKQNVYIYFYLQFLSFLFIFSKTLKKKEAKTGRYRSKQQKRKKRKLFYVYCWEKKRRKRWKKKKKNYSIVINDYYYYDYYQKVYYILLLILIMPPSNKQIKQSFLFKKSIKKNILACFHFFRMCKFSVFILSCGALSIIHIDHTVPAGFTAETRESKRLHHHCFFSGNPHTMSTMASICKIRATQIYSRKVSYSHRWKQESEKERDW